MNWTKLWVVNQFYSKSSISSSETKTRKLTLLSFRAFKNWTMIWIVTKKQILDWISMFIYINRNCSRYRVLHCLYYRLCFTVFWSKNLRFMYSWCFWNSFDFFHANWVSKKPMWTVNCDSKLQITITICVLVCIYIRTFVRTTLQSVETCSEFLTN